MHLTRLVPAITVSLAAALVLQACERTPEVVLPEGPQTVTGTLLVVPLSVSRDGTHVIRVNGEEVYYAESNVVNLRSYERMTVGLTGELQHNIDPDALPVMIVTSVSANNIPLRTWKVNAPAMSLGVPEAWTVQTFTDGVQFSQTGSATVFLKIFPSTLTQLPAAEQMRVGGLRAARIDTESGSTVHVQTNRSIITIAYNASGSDNTQEFEQILRTISFGQAASSATSRSATGSTLGGGDPCGGVAGILCPAGQYCEVTDAATGIGRCKSLSR